MNRLIRLHLCALLILLPGLVATAHGEDLLQIYQQALQHDARWTAAQHSQLAGQEKQVQGRAGLLPTLNLTGNKNYYDANIQYQPGAPFASGQRDYNSSDYGANLTQPLIRLQNIAQYRQSGAQADLAQAQLLVARNEFVLRVVQGYMDALLAQDSLVLATGQKTTYQQEYEQAQARFSAGAAPITDVHETKSRLELAIAQEIAAQSDVQIKYQGLQRLTGTVPGALAPLRGDFRPQQPDPAEIGYWLQRAAEQSPQVRAQKLAFTIADFDVDKARAAHLPTVDAVAAYSVNKSSGSIYTTSESEIKSKSAGIQVQMAFFQGGLLFSRDREAIALREKARADLDDTQRAMALQAQQAYLAVVNSLSQIRALEQAVTSSTLLVDAMHHSRRVGLKTQTDVLNAEQQLLGARRDLVRARYQHITGQLQLKGSVDVLEVDDILQTNGLLAGSGLPVPASVLPGNPAVNDRPAAQ
jgi:outer membrane protein